MSIYVQTNILSLNAQRMMARSSASLDTSLKRLASGLRINSARDDAAGLQISNRMASQVKGLTQGNRNANDGISYCQVMEGAMDEMTNAYQRIRQLALQSANGTNSTYERIALQEEVSQLCAEINRISTDTTYGGKRLLCGQTETYVDDTVKTIKDIKHKENKTGIDSTNVVFQVGSDSYQTIEMETGQYSTYDIKYLDDDAHAVSADFLESCVLDTSTGMMTVRKGHMIELELTGRISYEVEEPDPTPDDPDHKKTVTKTMAISGAQKIKRVGATGQINNSDSSSTPPGPENSFVEPKKINGETEAQYLAMVSDPAFTQFGVIPQTPPAGITSFSVNYYQRANQYPKELIINEDEPTLGWSISDIARNLAQQDLLQDPLSSDGNEKSFTTDSSQPSPFSIGTNDRGKYLQFDISTAENAQYTLNCIDMFIQKVDSTRAQIGAVQNRIESTISNQENVIENVSDARSRIRDTDYSIETAEQAKFNILNQCTASIMVQANQKPNIALNLLQALS